MTMTPQIEGDKKALEALLYQVDELCAKIECLPGWPEAVRITPEIALQNQTMRGQSTKIREFLSDPAYPLQQSELAIVAGNMSEALSALKQTWEHVKAVEPSSPQTLGDCKARLEFQFSRIDELSTEIQQHPTWSEVTRRFPEMALFLQEALEAAVEHRRLYSEPDSPFILMDLSTPFEPLEQSWQMLTLRAIEVNAKAIKTLESGRKYLQDFGPTDNTDNWLKKPPN